MKSGVVLVHLFVLLLTNHVTRAIPLKFVTLRPDDIIEENLDRTLEKIQGASSIYLQGNFDEGTNSSALRLALSSVPDLRHLTIDPFHDLGNGERGKHITHTRTLVRSLPKPNKLESLKVNGLHVHDQMDVMTLSKAISSCESLRKLHIDPLNVGYRDVQSMDPFFGAATDLANLADVHFGIFTFGNEAFADALAKEGLGRLREAENLGTVRLNTASGNRILTTASEAARRAAVLAAARDRQRSASQPKKVPTGSEGEQRAVDDATEKPADLEDRNSIEEDDESEDDDDEEEFEEFDFKDEL